MLLELALLLSAQVGQAFEMKSVTVRIDMPATHDGVDIYPERDQPFDKSSYQQRIKEFGVAYPAGKVAIVSKVKVKDRTIEFQLGRGGYGTYWDERSTVSSNTSFSSPRERSLESQIQREKDPSRKRSLESSLRYARRQRERENDKLRKLAAEQSVTKKQEIAVKRLDAGSRFNIRFDNAATAQAATPEMIRKMLADYLDFDR